MSAWIVSNGHIDVLVNALAAYGLLEGDPRAVGQDLWEENYRSVNARYGRSDETPAYVLHTTEATLHPAAVLKAISCYDYQSCEHYEWDDSAARKRCVDLEHALQAKHPELADDRINSNLVYRRAPWGFDDVEQAGAHNYPEEDR